MHKYLLLLLTCTAAARVIEDDECRSRIDAHALIAPTDVIIVTFFDPDASLSSLYRQLGDTSTTTLALECGSERIVVHFGTFRSRLGCIMERVEETIEHGDSLAANAQRVLNRLEHWQRAQECALPSDIALATVFWAVVSCFVYVCMLRRRREASHE